jgi:hypothetical protein
VVDRVLQRYSIFDSTGVNLADFPRQAWGGMIPRAVPPVTFDSDGAYLEETYAGDLRSVVIVRVPFGGEAFDTLPGMITPKETWPRQEGPQVARAVAPGRQIAGHYRPKLIYAVTPMHLWHADSRELLLVQRTHAGDTTLIVETKHRDDLRLSSADERAILEDLRRLGLDPREAPYSRQVIQSMHVLEDGHLLVQIEERFAENGSALDVFDPEGHFLGTLDLGFALDPQSVLAMRGDTLYAVGLDEMDAKFIAKLIIHRSGAAHAGR